MNAVALNGLCKIYPGGKKAVPANRRRLVGPQKGLPRPVGNQQHPVSLPGDCG